MIWPPQGAALFEYKKPCCECSLECFLEMPADPDLGGSDVYDFLTDARDVFVEDITGCVVYDGQTPDYLSFDVLTAGTALIEIDYEKTIQCGPPLPPPFPSVPCGATATQWFKINAPAGALSIPYDIVSGGVPSGGVDEITVTTYDSDYNVVTTDTDSTAGSVSGTFSPVLAAAGNYLVKVYVRRQTVNSFPISPTMQVNVSLIAPDGTTLCPARATFPSSGDTPYFVCCPGIESRVIGGIANICGFSEVPGLESSPPKKYYRKTFEWIPADCDFDETTCDPPTGGSCPDPITNCSSCPGAATATSCDNGGNITSLSNESTPEDAIARLLAGSSWSSWST